MKIISKFKDYYDGVVALGVDSNLIYERITEIVSFESLDGYDSFIRDKPDTFELERINLDTESYYTSNNYINFKELVIGFCGKLYPAFEFVNIKDKKEINRSVFYSAEDIDVYLSQLEDKYKNLTYGNMYNYKIERPGIDDLNIYLKSNVFEKDYTNWFQIINCPVFKFTEEPNDQNAPYLRSFRPRKQNIYIQKNPVLSELEFFRKMDSFTVFQSLGQFLGGVLTNTELNHSTLNDKQKVQQHGFDEKYGFRKRPNK